MALHSTFSPYHSYAPRVSVVVADCWAYRHDLFFGNVSEGLEAEQLDCRESTNANTYNLYR